VAFSKRPGMALALIVGLVAVIALGTGLWLWLALRGLDEDEPLVSIQVYSISH
jgi:hypothetical protein